MTMRHGPDLLQRWQRNPILTLEDVPYRANTVFNATPVKVDGTYYLIIRVEGQEGYSFFSLARSGDGLHFEMEKQPCMLPANEEPWKTWEENGIEDPRLTVIDGEYYVMYTAVSRYGHYIAVAKTENFHSYQRIAIISEPGNKDGVLFPEKVNGLYARLDRPYGRGVGSMWISYSPDMEHWGQSEFLCAPRPRYWDQFRIGASAPPIRTNRGWLEIYHGVKMTSAGPIYRIGTMMLDLENPAKVVGRCLEPLLSPRTDYERIGDVGNVCFACGAIVEDDEEVKIYYGAADTSICVATCTLDELIESCFECSDGMCMIR
ncbi:MAG: glycoside hydrolase family 130 protein [Phycisphaerae bacterium]|nr:glycoside hydrolase family 130 protein [Phycisphaerae bacterium]